MKGDTTKFHKHDSDKVRDLHKESQKVDCLDNLMFIDLFLIGISK